jgi:alpha-tubulin suppressor-like RCC1 family protein
MLHYRRLIGVALVAMLVGSMFGAPMAASATSVRPHAGQDVKPTTVWATVSTGANHTCGLQVDHTLWCWGSNYSGQLGLGGFRHHLRPTRVGGDTDWADIALGGEHSCAIRSDQTLWCWGDNVFGSLGTGDGRGHATPTRVGTDADWCSRPR